MNKNLLFVIFLFSSQGVSAIQGEVCTEKEWEETKTQVQKGLNNEDVYNCPSLGNLTIPQMYQKGWHVVLLDAAARSEKDGLVTFWKRKVLIEKIQ